MQLKLSLNKHYYEDYLRWLFESPTGEIIISHKMNLGKYLYAMVHTSDLPVNPPEGDIVIDIKIATRHTKLIPNKFYFYPPAVLDQINDMLEFYFDTDLRYYCLIGSELSMPRKQVYESFMTSRKMRPSREIYDMIKQRDYRRRQKLAKILNENMQQTDFQY
jgi:hypothetical protein